MANVAKIDLTIRKGASIEFAVIHQHDSVSICFVDERGFSIADISMPLALWESIPNAIKEAQEELLQVP